ncbi:hypothetical protein [Bradyrhizobium sp. Tv2a-2]|uniref:hypothetical protein n=1 Tax=Bradyrhizobium sp. Tv2a-2 TaxID=113395 RepID=UPI0004172726|nr:hypothetical protein [Bradyrhizobium sp. Tv2a-2]
MTDVDYSRGGDGPNLGPATDPFNGDQPTVASPRVGRIVYEPSHGPAHAARAVGSETPNFISTVGGRQQAEPAPDPMQSRQAEVAKLIEERRLRDQFAVAALPTVLEFAIGADVAAERKPAIIATTAYDIADAMLAERAKRST